MTDVMSVPVQQSPAKFRTFGGPDLFGYVAEPEVRTRSGVLILPTIFGVNAFARSYAATLAEAGLTTAVWDLNSGLPLTEDYQECIKRARTLNDQSAAGMIGRWLDAMRRDFALTHIAVLGFCIGGRFALLQAAIDKTLSACAVAYPSIESPRLANQERDAVALAASIACPVIMLRPGNDHVSSPKTYEDLTQALLTREQPTTIQFYPAAEHGFMHRKTTKGNIAAAEFASPQLVAFLKACLAA